MKRTDIIFAVLCLFIFLGCSKKNPADAPQTVVSTSLSGTVLCDGQPVEGVLLRLQYHFTSNKTYGDFSEAKSCTLLYSYAISGYLGPIIYWRDSNEVDTYQWEIARTTSNNSFAFSVLGCLPGMGTNPQSHLYQYYDTTLAGKIVGYYRLGEIDISGLKKLFNPIPFAYEASVYTDSQGKFNFANLLVDSICSMPDTIGVIIGSVKTSNELELLCFKDGYFPRDTNVTVQKNISNTVTVNITSQ